MALALMQLGSWQFSVPGLSYDHLRRAFDYRWAPQERVGRRPAEQFMGPGEERLGIRGIIYPQCTGGYNTLNSLRAGAQTGTPYPLTGVQGGIGYYYGPWCIRLVRDEQEFFMPNGAPRKVEFELDLVAYGSDYGVESGWSAIREGWVGTGVRQNSQPVIRG